VHKYKTHLKTADKITARNLPEQLIAELLQKKFANIDRPVTIAIGGPGGIGKSSFCKRLQAKLPNSTSLHLDDYKTPRATRQAQNLYGAHPDANEMELIATHLQNIRNDVEFDRPLYDTVNGTVDKKMHFKPAPFTLIDGEISTYHHFHKLIDFSIFIDSDWKTQLQTRINRDIDIRGYSRDKAIATFLQSNLREFSEHGAESKQWADIHLFCKPDYRLIIESIETDLYHDFSTILKQNLPEVDFSGLIVPILTPFDNENNIDKMAYSEHLKFLADNGIQRILVNGTTGEFFSLSPDERRLMLALAREYFPGLIMFQAGCDSLIQTQHEAEWADNYGADAIVALPPYYYAQAPQAGIIEYYNQLGAKLQIPLIIYNFPLHTQNPITPTMLRQIKHFGLKDSSGNPELISATEHYYSAGPLSPLDGMKAGACGFVASEANVFPKLYVELENALNRKDLTAAARIENKISPYKAKLSGANNIARCKQALQEKIPTYPVNVRLPLMNQPKSRNNLPI
jgi:dihydrodipicolinate synthase/N-acetylneuraminate lyase/uridine kinase